jgi:hypothetical protein
MKSYKDDVIDYPKEFIEKAKAEFPKIYTLHKALDNGRLFLVGKIINNISKIHAKNCVYEIKKYSKNPNLKNAKKIEERHKKAKRYNDLYQEWQIFCAIYFCF